MLSSLIFNSNKKVINWISTGVSYQKFDSNLIPFDTNLEPTMSNLANDRVKLKFNNSGLVQKSLSSLYSNFILNL